MARQYGWAPVGERCRDSVPFGHWKTMTFIAGLRLTGMTAPWVLDGAMDGDAFRAAKAEWETQPGKGSWPLMLPGTTAPTPKI